MLAHHPKTVGGSLPHVRLTVGRVVEHLLYKMLLVSERLRTRVFNHVIKNAQAPLMIGPRPIRFLKYTNTLKSHIPLFLGLDVSLGMRPNTYNLNN